MISANIKALRQAFNLTQEELAARVGVSSGVITNIELNRIQYPEKKMPLFRLIADTFGIPLEWILADDPGPVPKLNVSKMDTARTSAEKNLDDPIVKSFLEWYDLRTDREKELINKALDDFYEILKRNRSGAVDQKPDGKKITAAARSGDRMEAVELSAEEEEAVLPPFYSGDI